MTLKLTWVGDRLKPWTNNTNKGTQQDINKYIKINMMILNREGEI